MEVMICDDPQNKGEECLPQQKEEIPSIYFFAETSNQANIRNHILKSVNISQYCQSVTKIFNQHRLSAITSEHNWQSLP